MKHKKVTLFYFLFISCITLNGCGQPKAPNETDIKDAVMESDLMIFSQDFTPYFDGNSIFMNNIDTVKIIRQQTESKSNITYCTIEMSNDSCKVIMDCNYNFSYYDDNKWYPEKQEIESFTFSPLSGVEEELAYNATVESLHAEPEIIRGYSFGQEYAFESTYELQLKEHETDLDNNIDKLVYDYYKSSDFCTEFGLVETYYTFNSNNGSWVYNETLDDNLSYEYNPEGQWRFHIFTHYYRINISDIDYANNTALIYYKDSSFQAEADSGDLTDCVRVYFTITDEGMRFSPIHHTISVGYTTEHDVYLLLKKDTMYVSNDGSNYTPVTEPRYAE